MKKAFDTNNKWTPEALDLIRDIEGVMHKVCEAQEEDWDMASMHLIFYEAVFTTFLHRRTHVEYQFVVDQNEKRLERINLFCAQVGGIEKGAEILGYTLEEFNEGLLDFRFTNRVIRKIEGMSRRTMEKYR